MSYRVDKINHLIRAEISELLVRQVKDPRLSGLITITRVVTAPDLSSANVFVSVMDNEVTKQEVLEVLNAAAGFFHKELKTRLTLYRIPILHFLVDNSIAEADRILQLIKQVQDS